MWPQGEETQELLAGARRGEAKAVNLLLERHRDAVQRLVRLRMDHRIQGRVGVSDVVQDVMVEASRRLTNYLENPVMDFHLWLRQIAKDRLIDAHRRHRVSAKRSVDRERPQANIPDGDPSAMELVARLSDGELTPAAAATQAEMTRRVEAEIARLSDQDAEMILMRHYEHLTNQEVAQALGLSGPAASMRYLRAIRKLREALSESPSSSTGGASSSPSSSPPPPSPFSPPMSG